jgi:hypothetical protein
MSQIDGCAVYPHQLYDDGNEHEFLKTVATFKNHHRMYFVPQRHRWSSVSEQVFDMLVDDESYNHENRIELLNNQWTQIGIACNCHNDFGEICVIDLGIGVQHLPEVSDVHLNELPDHDHWDNPNTVNP